MCSEVLEDVKKSLYKRPSATGKKIVYYKTIKILLETSFRWSIKYLADRKNDFSKTITACSKKTLLNTHTQKSETCSRLCKEEHRKCIKQYFLPLYACSTCKMLEMIEATTKKSFTLGQQSKTIRLSWKAVVERLQSITYDSCVMRMIWFVI